MTLNQYRSIFGTKKNPILSDLHLGKTAHFRKNGIAFLPNGVIEKDLENLQKLIEHYET